MSTTQLKEILANPNNQPLLLLDARSQEEYEVSHLPNAKLTCDPLEEIKHWEHLAENTTIVVYCAVGYRSAIVAQQLQKMGYVKVFNLEGSIFEWFCLGYPLYQKGDLVKQVHPYNDFWRQYFLGSES